MPVARPPGTPIATSGGAGAKSAPTVGQVFQARGLWPWFSTRPTNYFNGQSERGEDYSTSFGTPVAVPVGGTIVRIVHNNNSIGDVVELQDSSGGVWLYQHITSKVKVGQLVGVGGVVGTENGLPVDQYSTGPHIEVRYCPAGRWHITTDSWVEPWVNPRSVFSALASQTAGNADTGNSIIGNIPGLNTIASNIHIAPDANVGVLLSAIDTALELRNPFNVSGVSDLTILGTDIGPNPIEYSIDVLNNIVNDLSAFIIRAAFFIIGIAILYAVVQAQMTSATNKALEPVGGVSGAVKLVGMLA